MDKIAQTFYIDWLLEHLEITSFSLDQTSLHFSMLVLFRVEEISDIPYSSRSWSFCRTWNDKYSGEKNSKKNVYHSKIECAKFPGSRAIVGLMGLVSSYQRALVGLKFSRGVSWVSRCFVGLKFFLVGPKIFLVSIWWVRFFFSWVFCLFFFLYLILWFKDFTF